MTLSNKTYDTLKWIAQILLPALATLYFALSEVWVGMLPYPKEVVGTITAIDIFLGALLGISSHNYSGDGEIIVDQTNPDKDIYSIAIPDYPETLAEKDQVMLRVSHPKHIAEE